MAVPAAAGQVVVGGGAAVGHRVDVVALDAVGLGAVDTDQPLESGGIAQLEGRAQLGGEIAPDVADRLDARAVGDHGLDEAALGQPPGHRGRDRPPADDVGDPLAGPAQSGAVPDDVHVGPLGLSLDLPGEHLDHGVGGVGSSGLV